MKVPGMKPTMPSKSFGMKRESDALWNSMQQVFADGFTTADLSRGGEELVSTDEFGNKVIAALDL